MIGWDKGRRIVRADTGPLAQHAAQLSTAIEIAVLWRASVHYSAQREHNLLRCSFREELLYQHNYEISLSVFLSEPQALRKQNTICGTSNLMHENVKVPNVNGAGGIVMSRYDRGS